jgi:hypothetical protein
MLPLSRLSPPAEQRHLAGVPAGPGRNVLPDVAWRYRQTVAVPAADRESLDLAVAVARRAGSVAAERFFETDFGTRTKQDGTEVTDVDPV